MVHRLSLKHLVPTAQTQGFFDQITFPMKGKGKPNGHKEKRGKQALKRNISERLTDYPQFEDEFGHLERDTIVGIHHKSAVITWLNGF